MTAFAEMPIEWPDWRLDALCWQISHVDVFYPEGKGAAVTEARAVCNRCPVAVECLEDALRIEAALLGTELGGRWGVRGGLTGRQRAALVRRKKTA